MKLTLKSVIILGFMTFVSLTAQFSGGSGTVDEPYLISSQKELNNIRHFPEAHFIQINDIELKGNWHPIGIFKGHYNGSNYYILSLNTGEKLADSDNVGLFGVLLEGSLSSIRLRNGAISAKDNVGALIGSNEGGVISNCSVEQFTVSGIKDVGSLVGSNFGEIRESYSASSYVSGRLNVGGLVGANYTGDIIDSYSSNNVSGYKSIGGLTGLNIVGGMISNCYATGKIDKAEYTGGLIGRNIYADVTNSYWDVEATGQDYSSGSDETVYGLSTFKMLQEESFTNWDFDEEEGIWFIADFNPYIRKHYPIFLWQLNDEEHNWTVHNMIKDAHVKRYRNAFTHWESFPRLEYQDNTNYTQDILQYFVSDVIIDRVNNSDFNYMWYDYEGLDPDWLGVQNIVSFNSYYGYILELHNNNDDYFLYVKGSKVADNDCFTITPNPNDYYWVGYWLHPTQIWEEAFGYIAEELCEIWGEDGMLIRPHDGLGGYLLWDGLDTMECYYGKMYKIRFREDLPPNPIVIQWLNTRSENRQYRFHKPYPQYFSFTDKPIYESFMIEEIENDEELLEIGVYAGEECVGASVFPGQYPFQVLAYTDETHIEKEISFVLHRGIRSVNDKIRVVEKRDRQNGEYTRQVLKPLQNKQTIIRLGAGDYTETVVTPQVVMGQNFPNPFVMGSGSQYRSESIIATNIPIYLSKDMNVEISVFNIKGQRVRTITSGNLTAGKHIFSWNGTNEQNQPVSAGVYFYKLESDIETINKKMLIIR